VNRGNMAVSKSGSKRIYPLYLVIDNSGSMDEVELFSTASRIDVAKGFPKALLQLYDESQDLVVNLRVSVLTFNKTARIEMPLSPVTELRNLNTDWAPRSRTHFGELFDTLREQIAGDFEKFSTNFDFHNPAIVIVTDGIPSDEATVRDRAYERLLEVAKFNQPLQVLMYGVDEARQDILERYATSPNLALKATRSSIVEQIQALIIILKQTVRDSLKRESETEGDSTKGWVQPPEDDDEEDTRW
jgi:uncharacterized protein YegL